MAINAKANPELKFNRRYRNLAGGGSAVLALLAIAGMVVNMVVRGPAKLPTDVILVHIVWIAMCCMIAAAGLSLLRNRRGALWVLLVFWVILAGGSLLQAFGWMLWGAPPLLPEFLTQAALLLILANTLIGTGMAALLVAATPAGSRSRYGSMVAVSIAAAVAVVFVVNMIALRVPYQKDFEILGRFALSERSRRILSEVDQPIRLCAVYADARGDAETNQDRKTRSRTRKYLRRVMELLDEIHRCNDKFEVTDASSDAARSLLMSRLRQRQAEKTGRHEALLKRIRSELPAIQQALANQQRQWAGAPAESFLGQWDMPEAMKLTLGRCAEGLGKADKTIEQDLAATPLPDYVTMLEKIVSQLKDSRELLDANAELLKYMAEIPAAVKANAPAVMKDIDKCVRAVEKLGKVIGKPGSSDPFNPADTLKKFAVELGKAGVQIRQASAGLDTIAGKDKKFVELVSVSRAWFIEVAGQAGRQHTTTCSRLLDSFAQQLDALRARTAIQISDANKDAQKRYVRQLREPVARLIQMMKDSKAVVRGGVSRLEKVDPFSRDMLARAEGGKMFSKLRGRVAPLLVEAGKLHAPKKHALPPDLSGRNIIVIETAEKVEIVKFDEVWPQRGRQQPFAADDEEPKRFFNGDSALASRILSLTQRRPFARVLITYFRPPPPKNVNPMHYRSPQGDIPHTQLQTVRKRLEEANFKVRDWNLTGPMPADAAGKKTSTTSPTTTPALPTVLLVLPPAPPAMPMTFPPRQPTDGGFGPKHIQAIRNAVNDGASAVFLATFLLPRQSPFGPVMPQSYPLNRYLRKDWGIDVKTNYMLIEGIAARQVGKFVIPPLKLQYMPLNGFTDEPIGKPLRGRRLYWPKICPIVMGATSPGGGVEVKPLLRIPPSMNNVWASQDIIALLRKIDDDPGGQVSPDYDKGDLPAPLVLAAAATRAGKKDRNIAPSRIVVLGLGGGLTDQYLNSPVPVLDARGGFKTQSPPRANADLLVNSVYWLIGMERYIAAGPIAAKPVREMTRTTRTLLWAFCVILLPLGVLAGGVTVLMMRKK